MSRFFIAALVCLYGLPLCYAKRIIHAKAIGLTVTMPSSSAWSSRFSPWAQELERKFNETHSKASTAQTTRLNDETISRYYSLLKDYMLIPEYLEIRRRNQLGEFSKAIIKIKEFKIKNNSRPSTPAILNALLEAIQSQIYKDFHKTSSPQERKYKNTTMVCAQGEFTRYYNLKKRKTIGKYCVFFRGDYLFEVSYYMPVLEYQATVQQFENILNSIVIES